MVERKRITPAPPPEAPVKRAPQRARLRAEPEEELETVEDEGDGGTVLSARREPLHAARGSVHAELRAGEGVHSPARIRRRRSNVVEDPFYIPLDEIPEGLSYEWKRYSVAGQEDPFYIAGMREQGWEPVNPKVHPNWVPPGYKEPHIIKGGQILMERPMELTKEAIAERKHNAKQQIRDAESRLGKADAGELARERPQIVKEYMRPVMNAED